MIKTQEKKLTFNSTVVHAGSKRNDQFGSHISPIYQTSTFFFKDVEEGSKAFQGENEAHIYSRLGNPTVENLEDAICDLETYGLDKKEDFKGMVFGSGMAAIATTIISNCLGKHVIAQDALYGCTSQFLKEEAPEMGITSSFVDMSDLFLLEMELHKYPNTKMIYLESIANPTMTVCDIESISRLAKRFGALVMVDNTFATPYHMQPLSLGADIIAHSTTKYLSGHGSVVGGALVLSKKLIEKSHISKFRKNLGGVSSPMDAWLLQSGLKTLSLRMEKHATNGIQVASFLEAHPKVARVWYPGLESHPNFSLSSSILKNGFGGVISFELKGGYKAGKKLMNGVQLSTLAVSLGNVDTLIQHPASMTHSVMDESLRAKAGITEGLVRLSVGIEDAEDIIQDLEQAL
ncbi:MAG: PLP-dependent aspartate aminotransferase family protein [Balneolaceae bacterium]